MRYPYGWCLVLALSLSLTACGRRQAGGAPGADVATSAPAGDASDAAVADVAPPTAAPLVISVVSEDGDALDADIFLAREPDGFDRFTHVDRPGPKALDAPCAPGQRFQARPIIQDFRQGKLVDCSPRLSFVMYSVLRTLNISRDGQQALDSGNFMLAQERLGLAADRYEFDEPAEAQRLRLMSTAAAGRLLGVEHPIDERGTRPGASDELKQRLRTFQGDHHLRVTGELDAETRGAISRMELRGSDVIVPPAAQFQQVEAPLADPRATVPASEAATSAAAVAAAAPVQEPSPDVRSSVNAVMIRPVSPDNAAIIRGNRLRNLRQPAQQ